MSIKNPSAEWTLEERLEVISEHAVLRFKKPLDVQHLLDRLEIISKITLMPSQFLEDNRHVMLKDCQLRSDETRIGDAMRKRGPTLVAREESEEKVL